MKGPHVPQARFLHHASRCDVHDHRGCYHALNAEFGEALLDQRAGAFGGITLAPGRSAQPVAELDLVGVVSLRRPEMEPSHESPRRPLYGGPEAVSGEALVVAEERRQNVALDLLARRRPTAVDEAHHVR